MLDINLFLFFSIIILFITNIFVNKQKRKNKLYTKIKILDLLPLLIKLSRDMNNQILALETPAGENILKLIKYQSLNIWGIKIVIDVSDEENIMNLLHYKRMLSYNLENDHLSIDVGNNYEEIIHVLKSIFINICNFDSAFTFNCLFEKKSAHFLQ